MYKHYSKDFPMMKRIFAPTKIRYTVIMLYSNDRMLHVMHSRKYKLYYNTTILVFNTNKHN